MDGKSRLQAIDIAIRHFDGKETAYDSKYLISATDSLGLACNAGTNILGYPLILWFGMFAQCHIGDMFSMGTPAIFLADKFSGVNLGFRVDEFYCGYPERFIPRDKCDSQKGSDTPEYDFGVCVCLLQWGLNVKFTTLISSMPALELHNLVRLAREHDFRWLLDETIRRWDERGGAQGCPSWALIREEHKQLNRRDEI